MIVPFRTQLLKTKRFSEFGELWISGLVQGFERARARNPFRFKAPIVGRHHLLSQMMRTNPQQEGLLSLIRFHA